MANNEKKTSGKTVATSSAKSKEPEQYKWSKEKAALIGRELERRKLPNTRLKVEDDGVSIGYEHEEPYVGQAALLEAIGANDTDFFTSFLSQIANAVSKGRNLDADEINFAMAVIKGIEPQDQIETMLAAQMATVHMATMRFARTLNHVETIQQLDSNEKTFNKLNRTYIAQMAALKKYRTGGEQKVKVEHVHVHEGGQAIVGDVNHTTDKGGLINKMTDYPMHKSPRCTAHSKRSGLPCKNPAVRGWNVCRMHGARGGAPTGYAHGNYKHGEYSKEKLATAELLKSCSELMSTI